MPQLHTQDTDAAASPSPYQIYTTEGGLDSLVGDELMLRNIHAAVNEELVVIIRNAFPEHLLNHIRSAIYDWGKTQPLRPPQTTLDENFHTVEHGVSPRQKTLHLYHAYNLNQIGQLPADLQALCTRLYGPMRAFYNAYTGYNAWWDVRDSVGMKLHPQAIQYPQGGGYLAAHVHKKSPQEIGLIVHGTQIGRDYISGGTGYATQHGSVDTDNLCRVGDMTIFNYGILHWVTPCELEKPLDMQSALGRWVFTLAYN